MTVTESKETIDQLPVKLKVGWGSGALGVALLMNGISALVLFFMISVLKIEPVLAGGLIFAAKIFDVVSDPVVGYWSDRIKSAIGRRRPFLFWGAFVCAGSFAMIFTTPAFGNQWVTASYVFAALIIYTVGYTVFNVPYMAMPAEMTDSYHERTSIHGYRMVFVTLGSFAGTSIAPVVLEKLGKTSSYAYSVVGVSGAAIIFVSMMACYFSTTKARFTDSGAAVPSIVKEFGNMMKNRYFLRLILIKFAQLTGFASFGAAMLFFITNTLKMGFDILLIFGLTINIVSMLSIPVLVALSKRVGKRWGYFISGSCYVLFSLSWVFAAPGEPTYMFVLRGIVLGIAFSGNVMFAMSMLTDTIEYDFRKTGERREGVYTALYSFTEKFSAAFGPLIIGAALSIAGFNKDLPPEAAQDPSVTQALLLGVSYIPSACGIIAIILLIGYKLTEEELRKAE